MKTLIVKKSDLSIASCYDGSAEQSKYGGPWGDSSQFTHIALPDEMDVQWASVANVDGELVVSEDTASKDIAKLADLRTVRATKLTESDWTQLADVPLGSSEKANWATYRQALRDITESYQSLDTVVWPAEPTPEV